MKTFNVIIQELNKILIETTSFEKTKIKVEVDRILRAPYRDHRIELFRYSIIYKSSCNCIFIYTKDEIDTIDNHEYLDDVIVNDGYSHKVSILSKLFK